MTSALIAGSGGQGILFLGKLIAHGAMLTGKKVTWFPSYGAEIRGGTANCTVVVSEDMIGSPVVKTPDILLVLNEASKERFEERVKEGGLMIMDVSLVKTPPGRSDIRVVEIPAAEIAASLGSAKSANMVMFGALLRENSFLDEAAALSALEEMTPPERAGTFGANKEAIKRGKAYRGDKKGKNS